MQKPWNLLQLWTMDERDRAERAKNTGDARYQIMIQVRIATLDRVLEAMRVFERDHK